MLNFDLMKSREVQCLNIIYLDILITLNAESKYEMAAIFIYFESNDMLQNQPPLTTSTQISSWSTIDS